MTEYCNSLFHGVIFQTIPAEPALDLFGVERLLMLFAELGPGLPSVLTSLVGNNLMVNMGGTALIGMLSKHVYVIKKVACSNTHIKVKPP